MKLLLSHHEIAILLLLLNAPAQIARGDPDAMALQQANLVEQVSASADDERLRLTPAGAELLRRLVTTSS